MNKVYKVVWNRTKHCYVVVSELAKRAGKNKSICLTAAGKAAAALGLGAVLLMGSAGSEVFAATSGRVIGGGGSDSGDTSQATGQNATVSGGFVNHAEGKYSSVSGGSKNHATGENSSISGGGDGIASGLNSSISGGKQNKATGEFSSVSGGDQNEAAGKQSTISGGTANKTTGDWSTIVGGAYNVASGNSSLALGGMMSAVQGMYSVGIAGGNTSPDATQGFAAGYQSSANVAYGTAIGYQAVANTKGTISFGHVKGDTYYASDPWEHTISTLTFDSDAYNRLVNVADGIDDHDVVVMEQLKNATAEAVATAKNQIKVKGDEVNVHAVETTDGDGVQTTTISLLPKVTLKQDTTTDPTGAKQVVLDGTAGTISAGLSTDQQNYISLNGTTGVAKVGAVEIGNQSFTYTYDKPDGMNDDGTVKLTSTRADAKGTFVTGLANTTWTPGNYVTGRAATEDQLEQAGRHFLSIKTADVDEDGNKITPVAENTLSNYYNDGATGSASMAFGVGTTAKGNLSLAMGVNSSASGLNSLAIGYGNEAAGTQSVAVGNSSNASGNYSVAMGLGAQAGTKNTDVESTDHGGAVAVGYGASAAETGSAAYGYSAQAKAVESSAFGTSAQANVEGSIALGAHSVANRGKGSTGYLAPDMTDPANAAKAATWVSTSGAVSLGGTDAAEAGANKTISRQITNLAAGSEDSDAVNVAQLKALASQGLNFQGNDTSTSVHLNQGGTLLLQGSGTKADEEYSTQNVKVLTDADHQRLSIALDKNPDFDSVTAGTALTDADGGKAGSIKIVGADSKNANKATTITAGYAASPELAGANGTGRISYTDGDGTAHTVATLGDGLKLAGDTGTGSVALDNPLTVSGGAKNLADGSNIGVTANGSTLSLKLAKNITGLDTVTAGGVKMGTQADGNDTTKSGDYVTGLDNKTWTVGQTQPVDGRAATENQLKSVSDVVNTNQTNIATNTEAIGKGLNFQANTKETNGSYKTVNRALGSTVAVRANDAQKDHTYKTDNLTTDIDDNGIITVKMDTQLTADKVTVGKDGNAITLDGSNGNVTTGSSTLGGTGLTIANGPSVTTGGISGGNQKITEVASGASGTDTSGNPVYGTDTNGANIGDVKKIAANTVTVSGDGTNTTVAKTTNADGTVDYRVSLNDSVTLGSDAGKRIALDGTSGTISAGDKVSLNGATGTATIGNAHLGNDGSNTYLTGLTNTTWNGTAVSGRAATEDQLQTVSNTVNAGWKAQIDGTDVKTVTPTNNTLNFVAGDNISLFSGKDIKIATTPDVNFTTVSVGGTNTSGTYTGGIFLGNQAGGGANGSADSPIMSITGLKNTAWVKDNFMSGRAATEDQLNAVAQQIKGEVNAADIYVESGSVSYDTKGDGTGTLQRSNKTTGNLTGLHDYYVTGGSVSADGKKLTLTKNGGDAIPGIDLTNVLDQDSHLVAADGGAYTVDSDGKVTLKVKNNVAGSTPTDVVISGIASNAALQQGLNFKANAAEKTDGSATYNAQLGRTVSVLGGAAQEKHTYNTDNITTTMDNGTITVKLDNDLTANSLTAGSNTVDGRVKVTGATGAYVEMDGSDGSIHLGNNGGRYSALYQNYGGKGFLSSATSPRLEYAVDNDPNTRHTIATLDDGMKFAGDDAKTDATKVVSRTLNSTLNITGGAATDNLTDGNIGVVKNDAGDGLTIKLNKDLTDMSTISFASTAGTTGSGIKIGSQTITNNGTSPNSATGDYITGLTNTKWSKDGIVSGRAATEDQLQQVANAIVNGSATGGGFGLSADNADSTNATEVKQDLGSAIKITTGGDTNLSTQADSANKAIVVSLNKELNLTKMTLTDGTTGATTVVDGNGVVITPKQGADADKVKLTTDGLSNGGKQITNVQSGLYDTAQNKSVDISTIAAGSSMLQNAATIGDLQTVSNGVKTDLTATGLNFKGNGDDTVHRNLGDTLIIQGTGADGRTYDGGANVQVLADDKTGTLTVQLDRDLNAHTMALGKASTGTDKAGEAGTLIINGTSNDGSTQPVSISTGYQNTTDDTKTALKTNMSRITYSGDSQHTHTVATLEDGLQLSGDNGETANTTLNKKVTIKGGVTRDKLVDNSTDPTKNNNIGVIASQDTDGNTTLSLQLAKDITGLNTVMAGTVVMGNQTVISKGNVSSTGNYVTGLGNTTWDGTDYVSGRAATEDQLKKVSDSIRDTVGASTFALTAGGQGEATDATITKNVGQSIRIFGDAPKVSGGGDGDGWDRSKANILTKVKKDNKGDEYISVELQDHLEVGTHAGKDTDGKDVVGVDGSMQFKGASAKEVNITGDKGVTLSDNGNETAVLHQDNGTGYLDIAGSEGAFTSLFAQNGAQNLSQDNTSKTRLTYKDQNDKSHDVATMDDGLVVAGDNGQVTRLLNSTLKLSGGETDTTKLSSGQNIGVVANKDNDGFDIKLAKDLTGIESITMTGGLKLNSANGSSTITGLTNTSVDLPDFGKVGRAATEEQLQQVKGSITDAQQGGGFGLADDKGNAVKADLGSTIGIHGDSNITTAVSEDGKSIDIKLNNQVNLGTDGSLKAGGVTISNTGIDAGSKNITNVASGIVNGDDSDNTNAANIGDVKTLAGEAAKTEIGKLGSRDFAGDDGETVSRGLGESMKLSGGADTSKLTNGNIGVVKNAAGDGLDISLSSELTGLTSVTTGNSTLNNDGLTINNSEGKAATTITSSGIKIAANGDNTHAVEVTNSNISMGGQQIHDVAPGTSDTDAVNVSQLKGLVSGVDGAVNKLNNRLNRVGAGAAALAALHPLDFNPEEKWNFAAGFGHYVNANAGAIGAFYQPNEDTLFSLGGSWGGGENMVNAGVSIRLGHGNSIIGSRTVMAREIMALKQQVEAQNLKLKENEDLKARLAKQDQEIAELKAMVLKLAAKG